MIGAVYFFCRAKRHACLRCLLGKHQHAQPLHRTGHVQVGAAAKSNLQSISTGVKTTLHLFSHEAHPRRPCARTLQCTLGTPSTWTKLHCHTCAILFVLQPLPIGSNSSVSARHAAAWGCSNCYCSIPFLTLWRVPTRAAALPRFTTKPDTMSYPGPQLQNPDPMWGPVYVFIGCA